jgi:hypothetical protein
VRRSHLRARDFCGLILPICGFQPRWRCCCERIWLARASGHWNVSSKIMVRAERKQKMKLQGSQASSANTLQNQSEVFAKTRFTINGLTVVHGRLFVV